MVRANAKQPPEEKETPKKKPVSKKKPVVTGVWPCKINGCNKQFAREADLKRHQRTTKLHSMPGFACPQCDATFTRTDALRRHQKSRHNGVIIDPPEQEKKDGMDEEHGLGSKSPSRSASPPGKNKEKATANKKNPTALAQPGTAGPAAGPSSYYRQHTVNTHAFGPRPPGMMMDAQYPQAIGLPTSATRLHQANWGQGPWQTDGPPPQMGYHQIPGTMPGYYQPSPYYRTNGTPMMHPEAHQQMNPEIADQNQAMHNGVNAHDTATSQQVQCGSRTGTPMHNVDPRLSHKDARSNHQTPDGEMARSHSHSPEVPAAPVIDPSLDANSTNGRHQIDGGSTVGIGVSMEVARAAVQAVIDSATSANREASLAAVSHASRSPLGGNVEDAEGDADGDSEDAVAEITSRDHSHIQQIRRGRPEPMDHMLTEDGEPMLNPAELLTQESLASPPPS